VHRAASMGGYEAPGDHAEVLTTIHSGALLAGADEVPGSVLPVILQRVREGSRPREREDEHVVCLAIEGGGMRGAVTAGMCVLLEAVGLTSGFDRIYGVSAGALNGWATAAGQAALGATHYHDAVAHGVVSRTGPLRGRPLVDFDLLFEELIAARKPLSFDRLATGPDFRALATSLDTMSLCVLSGFTDVDEVIGAVRASAFLPRFSGEPPSFRGERMADGSLVEPIPFQTALDEGATHVLVLRSRPVGYRRPAFSEVGEILAVRDDPGLLELLRSRLQTYNRQAAALERDGQHGGAHVQQIVVPADARLVGSLQANAERVTDALRYGAKAMASAVLTEPVDLCWQPVVYRAARPPAGHREEPGPRQEARGLRSR
jgi:predicted patatin/cPLA2 family phospholipase